MDAPPPSPPASRNTNRTDKIFVLTALTLLVLGCFIVIKPFLSAVLWAVVLTFSTWPAYRRLLGWVGGRRTLAATIMTLVITVVLLLPFTVIGLTLAENVKEFATATMQWVGQGPPQPPEWIDRIPWIGEEIREAWIERVGDGKQLLTTLQALVDPVSSSILKAGATLGMGVLELSLSIFLGFFFYRDGATLGDRALAFARRLAGERGDRLLLDVAGGTVRGVVYGIFATAVAQGLIAGTGFYIAGVPAAALLGLITFFVSVIPFGPPMVWVPATIWVFQTHGVGWAIFMALWGFVVSSVDNVLRPLLISQGNKMPFVLIFMGVVGGALAFGLIGVFLGPTLLAVSYRLTEEWLTFKKKPDASGIPEEPTALPMGDPEPDLAPPSPP